jgi:2-polyprenyl-3-methyl-5-hydroxy-6-metoxy-1,4-benzoquinol methylase
MLKQMKNLKLMLLETLSPHYAKRIASEFWSNCGTTHSDMSENMFKYYYEQIKNTINPSKNNSILDYGCGFGEISWFFSKDGYNIDCCDISSYCIERTKNLGLNACLCSELINSSKKYDIIFINNAFFYIHPECRKELLAIIHDKLNLYGKLYIFDEPDYSKRKLLNMSKLHYMITSLFPVYQQEMAGFFNKPTETQNYGISCGFKNVEVIDSWCNYRSHFIFYK